MTNEDLQYRWNNEDLSNCLGSLRGHLESLGAIVRMDTQLKANGQIDYETRLIRVNEPTALFALTTLAHEGGHYLHFLRNPLLETNRSIAFREKAAYLLGWHLLCRVGAVQKRIVTKGLWRVAGIGPENATLEL